MTVEGEKLNEEAKLKGRRGKEKRMKKGKVEVEKKEKKWEYLRERNSWKQNEGECKSKRGTERQKTNNADEN